MVVPGCPLCKLSYSASGVEFDRDMARSFNVADKGRNRVVSGYDGPVDLLDKVQILDVETAFRLRGGQALAGAQHDGRKRLRTRG